MNFTPGFIMVLHTFGRYLKWNPHIHCLISEGEFSDNGVWRTVNYFDYTFLRYAFRTALLNEMESLIGTSFKKVKSRCYREHKDGFYVYAKPNGCDPKTAIKYIGRYLGRPVMEFIGRLIQHIPEKHYKMIRYGGIYARHREIDQQLHRAISREKRHIYRSFNQ
ncbi:MAG: transposase [Blautia sp.]|nr:transposase [Blautia sp.]MCB6723821.1 transposase [Blautia marasmi]MDY4053399.1 transposase [Blautia sp.]